MMRLTNSEGASLSQYYYAARMHPFQAADQWHMCGITKQVCM